MDIDIQKILSQLQGCGLTQSQIGNEIGCSQPNVCDMANGRVGKKRPGYQTVTSLIALAKKHGIEIEKIHGRRKADHSEA